MQRGKRHENIKTSMKQWWKFEWTFCTTRKHSFPRAIEIEPCKSNQSESRTETKSRNVLTPFMKFCKTNVLLWFQVSLIQFARFAQKKATHGSAHIGILNGSAVAPCASPDVGSAAEVWPSGGSRLRTTRPSIPCPLHPSGTTSNRVEN